MAQYFSRAYGNRRHGLVHSTQLDFSDLAFNDRYAPSDVTRGLYQEARAGSATAGSEVSRACEYHAESSDSGIGLGQEHERYGK